MKTDPQETKDGTKWFFVAGTAAVLLSVFLQYVDFRLTTSDSEIVKGNMLRELRTAQANVSGRATDDRQIASFLRSEKTLLVKKAQEGEQERADDNEQAQSNSEAD